MRLRPLLIAAAFVALAASPVLAAEGGCEAMGWSVAEDAAWINGSNIKIVASGETLETPPDAAMSVVLDSAAKVKLAVPPTGRPKKIGVENYGGTVNLGGVPTPGLYQVSVNNDGWVDIVQNGAALEPVAEASSEDCPGVRKSLRYQIGPGPFILQLSSVPRGSVKVTIRPADTP